MRRANLIRSDSWSKIRESTYKTQFRVFFRFSKHSHKRWPKIERESQVADGTCHNPLNAPHSNTLISCSELPNNVTHVFPHRVREHFQHPLCSLLGEQDNQTSLMMKYHGDRPKYQNPIASYLPKHDKSRSPTPQTKISCLKSWHENIKNQCSGPQLHVLQTGKLATEKSNPK